ncbi:MAG: hypothetical protein IJ092_03060 [Atopobiaceae bacterium]|nr:hypothetical protein [Atopobiaceae bacterium]
MSENEDFYDMSLGEAVKTVKRAMGEMRGMANELSQARASRDHWREKCEGLESEMVQADMELAECYARLPVDAEGVVIHLGDELDVGTVQRIVLCDESWDDYVLTSRWNDNVLTESFCHEVSHAEEREERTLEDVLRGLVEAAENPEGGRLDNGDIDGFADEIRDLLGVDDGA